MSGGVAGIQDVVNLKQWNHPQIHGMIVGKAYYEGRMDLSRPFDWPRLNLKNLNY